MRNSNSGWLNWRENSRKKVANLEKVVVDLKKKVVNLGKFIVDLKKKVVNLEKFAVSLKRKPTDREDDSVGNEIGRLISEI